MAVLTLVIKLPITAFGECGMISEATQSACFFQLHSSQYGMIFWTAGQRIDPTNYESTFVWRQTSTDTYSDTVFVMRYTNWNHGQPDNGAGQSCMWISSAKSYKWHDDRCIHKCCAVCEIDIA